MSTLTGRRALRALLGIPLVLLGAVALIAVKQRGRIPVYEDEDRTRLAILQRVPLGSSVGTAQRIMDRGGFRCVVEDDVDLRPDPWTRRIYCWRSKWAWVGERDWRVSLALGPDNRVVGIDVTYAITGP